MNRQIQITQRVVALLLVAFLLSYVGYQAHRFLYNPISTETVYEYTVSRSIQTQGIAIREETPLAQNATGMEYYPLDDASRVAIGETVAEAYRGGTGDRDAGRARQLEEELRLLMEAQSTPADFSNAEIYNRDIKATLSELSAMGSEGRYSDLDDIRSKLTLNINKKQISTGKISSFAQRIGQLQSELQRLSSGMQNAVRTGDIVTAPMAGYFSKAVDGYENLLYPGALEGMKIADYVSLMEATPPSLGTGKVGKMVHSEKWTFAVTVPSHNAEWIKVGQQVNIEFDQISRPISATIREVITEKRNETAVLLLTCNDMTEELINLRVSGATVYFQSYSGIRINTSDLRFRTNSEGVTERGVYVLRNNKVYFRLVDTVYEEATFVLSKSYYSAEEYLEPQRQARRKLESATPEPDPEDLTVEEQEAAQQAGEQQEYEYKRYVMLFDQVITKGFDLHDGKVLQDY